MCRSRQRAESLLNRLLIDTSVALELIVVELGDDSRDRATYRRVQHFLKYLNTIPRRDRLVKAICSRFGELTVTAGVLHELDRHAENCLIDGQRRFTDKRLFERYWAAYERLQGRFALARDRPMVLRKGPFTWQFLNNEDWLRLGPVDAHQLRSLTQEKEVWLLTSDHDLFVRAREVSPRALHVTDLLD